MDGLPAIVQVPASLTMGIASISLSDMPKVNVIWAVTMI